MIAFVRGVIAASSASPSTSMVSSATSTRTIVAPTMAAAEAVAG